MRQGSPGDSERELGHPEYFIEIRRIVTTKEHEFSSCFLTGPILVCLYPIHLRQVV